FDFALVEVFLELGPLLFGGGPVLLGGSKFATMLEKLLVVAHDVLVEHGDVAAGGLQIGMPEQRGADVDGQAVVDQLGGEDPSGVGAAAVCAACGRAARAGLVRPPREHRRSHYDAVVGGWVGRVRRWWSAPKSQRPS